MRPARLGPAVLTVSSLLFLITACGSSQGGTSAEGTLSVVASTNVYGGIASAVGGPGVEVTSIIDDPSADPHSFEANARTQLAVSKADVVVENGGGYDDFLDTLISSTGTDATVVNAVDVSGRSAAAEAAGEQLNEHVWYDFPTVEKVAGAIAAALGKADPGGAGGYSANAAAFTRRIDGLIAAEEQARPATQGVGVVVTEPVPGYLLDALGAVDRTPREFSAAIEEGGDVSPSVLRQTLDLFSSGQVSALVYNEQTTGPQTDQVVDAAKRAGVAVVPVAETLPAGEDYVAWMQRNLDAVVAALST
ncbi:MAG: ABC-type metal ion transport system [Modestobacter sp.]|jgi:zinc/manganese transport system substrate-binding protein|nr:ABC-type metal ion transport system [Modestobacter sp.]